MAAASAGAKPLVSFESTVGNAFTVVTLAVEALPSAAERVWTQSKVSCCPTPSDPGQICP